MTARALGGTRREFDLATIFLHWIGAALIVAMYLIGDQLEDLPRGDERNAMLALHVSLGLAAWPFLAARIVLRVRRGLPDPLPQPRALVLLSHAVQWGLLLALTVLILTGPLIHWTVGRPLPFFGLFEVPSPMSGLRALHGALETIHGVAAKAIVALLILHVLGALKHLLLDRDGRVLRIVGRRREG